MITWFRNRQNKSLNSRILSLITAVFVPMLLLSLSILFLLIVYNAQYDSISNNIVKTSTFNQDFKDDVDLKMYYFVSGSSDELPYTEIEAAKNLAESLTRTTENPDSRRAISNVLNLCDSLYESIDKIKETEGYDNRITQLETNVYVITQLIQDHVYTYLYFEAGELAQLQRVLTNILWIEIIVVLVIMAIIAVLSIRAAVRIRKSVTDPILELSNRVEEIGRGELIEKSPVKADDERLDLLSRGVEEMVRKLSQQIELNRQEQEKMRSIELALLQAQINPHFLYNTLDAIVWLIETDQGEAAEKMVTSLSTYFRSFLSNGKDIITLEEELTHVRAYLEIQQVRYKDRLEYTIESIPVLSKCLVPKLTLQPIVENAIYHGIKQKRGKGLISIRCNSEDAYVLVTVNDTGLGMTAEELNDLRTRIYNGETTGFGLIAGYKRLTLMYGTAFTFSIDSEPGVGTTVSLRIPFQTEETNEQTN